MSSQGLSQEAPAAIPPPLPSRRAVAAERQAPCRQREHAARCHAVQFCHEREASCSQLARQLGIVPRTLRHWKLQQERAECESRPLGRPPKESPPELLQEARSLLLREGPVGVATLRAALGIPRCVAIDLWRDYRDWHQQQYRMGQQQLTWLRPGSVWAVDHTEPPVPIDGRFPYILAIRDLASGLELAWLPVPDVSAVTTLTVVENLFRRHGPPLVFKSDNGPAFKSHAWAETLAAWHVTPLLSPAHTPRYNGSCEASIQAMQKRTAFFAARHGRPGHWTTPDLESAQRQANELHRPEHRPYASAQQVWGARLPMSALERAEFEREVGDQRAALREKYALARQGARERAKLEREAVREALVEGGLLSVSWRSVPLPLKAKKVANIT